MTDENKSLKAAAINYDEKKTAPVIEALGEAERAEAIIAMAKHEGIYIHKDKRLMDELCALKEGDAVPKELFGIIAAILSFSYLLQGKTPERYTDPEGNVRINTEI